MNKGAFLPERSFVMAALPWLKATGALGGLSVAVVAGALAVRAAPSPSFEEERGAELVIEFAPMITQAESRPQLAAAEQAQPDQQAKPELEQVKSQKTDIDLPTEQASPSEAEDPDLRMAKERTREEAEVAPEMTQATEAAEAQEQKVQSEASVAVEAAPEQRAEAPAEKAAAPDVGNAKDAERRINAWQKAIFAHIGRFKTYPEEARKKHIKGDIVVAFVLDRKGGVSGVRVETGSGYPVLDQAALAVLSRAAPLPPPPREVGGETVELLLPMRYQLR